MELVRGPTLREVLDQRGALAPARALAIARQVADALAHAHTSGLVHRDVKPGNILLADDGRVLVTDFGIAKAAEETSDLTEAGQVVGTAKYLSPEQVSGKPVDGRSDVYALGVVLYEMLCGRPPFSAETSTATALARLTTEPLRPRQVRAGLQRDLEDVVLRAMARDPEARYQSASALCSALDGVDLRKMDDDPSDRTVGFARDATPLPAPLAGRPRFGDTERAWLVPAALIVVVALTLLIVGLALSGNDVGRAILDAAGAGDDSPPVERLAIDGAPVSFDPEGDGREGDRELAFATDGDVNTAWTTERYNSAAFGLLKDGVGIALSLPDAADLDRIELDSPTRGWSVEVYVAPSPGATVEDWGAPVASAQGIDGDITLDLGGASGSAVLVWITDLGDGSVGDRFSTGIAETRLFGS
jgi:hypothetical protein